jgi:hypothetical protein
VRGVSHAFQMSSWKNVRGLKCCAGVKSLNERGSRRRGGTGRCGTGFVMRRLDSNPKAPGVKRKMPHQFIDYPVMFFQ